MKFKLFKPIKILITLFTISVSASLLSACGGGGALLLSGIGGTGIVFGTITGFGSVYVNGSRYDTGSSNFIVDGESASQAELRVGMVVKLKVEIENGALGQNAVEVIYDDAIEGPIADTPVVVPGSGGSKKTFEVFGKTIVVDENGTVFEGTSFSGIDSNDSIIDGNDVVEISGFLDSNDAIVATFVKKTGSLILGVTEVELRGLIDNYLAGAPDTFEIDGIDITVGSNPEIEVSAGGLRNGIYVEVEGVIQSPTSILVDEIEEEDEDFGDEVDEISLQGIITDYSDNSDFRVNGQQVDASGASFSPSSAATQLGDDVEVEVEGDIVGGILIADEVELRQGEVKLKTVVSFVDSDNDRFEVSYPNLVGSIVVNIDDQTQFSDEGPLQLPNFSLLTMGTGDYVIIEGREIAGQVVAESVKRKDALNPDDSKLEGTVDAFTPNSSITILGISYVIDPTPGTGTEFENFADADAFFIALGAATDPVVEIKDEVTANGIADEVELE